MYIFFFILWSMPLFLKKKVMRNQCKVLSYPPLFSGADGMSTATPSASESEAVRPSTVLCPCSFFSVPFFLPSLPLPPPSLLLVPKVIFKKELEVLFLLMFSLTGHALCVGSAFSPVTLLWESFPALSLRVGRWREEGWLLFGGPSPLVSIFLLLLCFPGRLLGRPVGPVRGEEGQLSGSGRGWGKGLQCRRSFFLFFTGGAGCLEWGWTRD